MGSSELSAWKPPRDAYTIVDYKYCRVWVRREDLVEHLEEYSVSIQNERDLRSYEDMFARRLGNSLLVSAVYFTHQPDYLCGSSQTASILLERIPHRLCQYSQLPYWLTLSILHQVLKACHLLYQHYGFFKLATTMIGLDPTHKIKVWHHTDYSQLQPQNPYCYSLPQMIEHIIKALEQKCVGPMETPTFLQYVNEKFLSLFSFEKTLEYLGIFCHQYSYRLAAQVPEIVDYLEDLDDIEQIHLKEHKQRYLKMYDRINRHPPTQTRSASKAKYSFRTNQIMANNSNAKSSANSSRNSATANHSPGMSKDTLASHNMEVDRIRARLKNTTAVEGKPSLPSQRPPASNNIVVYGSKNNNRVSNAYGLSLNSQFTQDSSSKKVLSGLTQTNSSTQSIKGHFKSSDTYNPANPYNFPQQAHIRNYSSSIESTKSISVSSADEEARRKFYSILGNQDRSN